MKKKIIYKKRILTLFIIFTLAASLFIPIVMAKNNSDKKNNNTDKISQQDMEKIPSEIKKGSNSFLSKEIKIPSNVKPIASVLLGINKEKSPDIQTIIVLIAVWLMVFLILQSSIEITAEGMMPSLRGFKSWVLALLLTCIVGVTGVIKSVASFFFNLGKFFGFLEEWGFFKIALAIIVVVLLVLAAKKLAGMARSHFMQSKAEEEGKEAAAGAEMFESAYEFQEESES